MLSVALALVIAIGTYLFFAIRADVSTDQQSAQPAPMPQDHRLENAAAEVHSWLEGLRAATGKPPAPPPAKPQINPKPVAIEPRSFELVDARPRKDKMSVDLGDGSVTAGDDQFSPDRISLLRERLTAVAGKRLAGKRIEVSHLVTWYVRTPRQRLVEQTGGLPPMPAEEYFDLPQLRKFPYWVICVVDLSVDGRSAHGRGVAGFASDTADFSAHHRQALISAINQAITGL